MGKKANLSSLLLHKWLDAVAVNKSNDNRRDILVDSKILHQLFNQMHIENNITQHHIFVRQINQYISKKK